jgi:hypothetical protein
MQKHVPPLRVLPRAAEVCFEVALGVAVLTLLPPFAFSPLPFALPPSLALSSLL